VLGIAPAARGAAGGGRLAAGGMAQLGVPRGPMTTFEALLQAHLAYNALADDDARAAFLRERKGFQSLPGRDVQGRPR